MANSWQKMKKSHVKLPFLHGTMGTRNQKIVLLGSISVKKMPNFTTNKKFLENFILIFAKDREFGPAKGVKAFLRGFIKFIGLHVLPLPKF